MDEGKLEKTSYATNSDFKRRYLYVHNVNYKKLAMEAIEKDTDVSQVLNAALAIYFSQENK